MKKIFFATIIILTIGCQDRDSGSNPQPIPAQRCEKYASEIAQYSGSSQRAIVRMMVLNSHQIDVSSLIDCLDQTLELSCQNDFCQMRNK